MCFARLYFAGLNRQSIFWLLVVSLAGCGGGGGGSESPSTVEAFSLSGEVSVPSFVAVDTDLNDPNAQFSSNDSPATSQPIDNPIMLSGFVSDVGTGVSGDRYAFGVDSNDFFSVSLAAGQFVSLRVVDFNPLVPSANDVDLFLYDTSLSLIASSISFTEFESIAVPQNGDYFIQVSAFSGINPYVLSVSFESLASIQASDSSDASDRAVSSHSLAGLPANFVPGEMIARYKPGGSDSVSVRASGGVSLMTSSHDDATREMLLSLDSQTPMTQVLNQMGGKGVAASASNSQIDFPEVTKRKLETLAFIKKMRMQSDLEFVEPNYILEQTLLPNDPLYGFQDHYLQLRLPQAWDITTGSPASGDVIVAVLDTGLFLAHEDLAPQLVDGYDFISNVSMALDGNGIDDNPDDPGDGGPGFESSWHGTHVAGTVGAASNNAFGGAGVSWGTKIMPVRVLGLGGGTSYDVLQGVRYAAGLANDSGTVPAQPADIINMSLGGSGFLQSSQSVYTQVYDAGVIVVAAAGNEASSLPSYPAAYDRVVSVSATDYLNNIAPYSNFGSTIDVAAPGGDNSRDTNGDSFPDGVLSAIADTSSGSRVSDYAFYQGTSMATPHVAGVVALMKAVYPGLTPAEFDTLLQSGEITNDLGVPGRDNLYGYGMIDAFKAVQRAQSIASSGSLPGAVLASPTSLNFSSTITSLTLTLNGSGDSPPTVQVPTVTASWLTVSEGTVDGSNYGTYNVNVDRTNLVDGVYSARIDFPLSDSSTLQVAVNMRVQSQGLQDGNAGFLYFILVDQDFNTQAQVTAAPVSGSYSYQFPDVASGEYFLLAGSDNDNDGFLCEDGESCGGYPLLFELQQVDLSEDRFNIDFLATINSGVTPASDDSAASGNSRFRRLDSRPSDKTVAR